MSKKLIVGILTVPLNPDGRYKDLCGQSFIVSAHLDWLKSVNIEPLIIPFYEKNIRKYANKVNGIYLPSGGAFAQTHPEYYFAAKELINIAKEKNDKGIYYPVWGCCMGMQQMLIEADKNDNYKTFLENFNSHKNIRLPLIGYKTNHYNSKIFSGYSKKQLKNLERNNSSLHNHKMGISPKKFLNNKNLSSTYKIINISYDRDNKPFVSTMEGIKYPFYGVQWHPERKRSFHKLVQFFKSELLKNSKLLNNRITNNLFKKSLKKKKPLFTQKIKCMKYRNNLYKYCNFYWTKKSKSNNPLNCKKTVKKRDRNGRIYSVIG